ncbi:hypothetical protein ACS78I_21760 [Yersinia enterocolitica]|uniref:hypothetical protein n=1 Tax=Yersinia enterocolitica TaxID=630 RepID=UPI003F477B6D
MTLTRAGSYVEQVKSLFTDNPARLSLATTENGVDHLGIEKYWPLVHNYSCELIQLICIDALTVRAVGAFSLEQSWSPVDWLPSLGFLCFGLIGHCCVLDCPCLSQP